MKPSDIPISEPMVEAVNDFFNQGTKDGVPCVALVQAPTATGKTSKFVVWFAKTAPVIVLLGKRVAVNGIYNYVRGSAFYDGIFNGDVAMRMGGGVHEGAIDARVTYMTDGLCQVFAGAGTERFAEFLGKRRIIMLDEVQDPTDRALLFIQQLPDLVEALKKDYGIILHLIFTTATLENEKFERHFENTRFFEVPGPTRFPLERVHLTNRQYGLNRPQANISLLEEVIAGQHPLPGVTGLGALIFSSGMAETSKLIELIEKQLPAYSQYVMVLNSNTSASDQAMIINRKKPKITIATEVASSSITILDNDYIFDNGVHKIQQMDYGAGEEVLVQKGEDGADAKQKAGRAARQRCGKCFHCWAEDLEPNIPFHACNRSELGSGEDLILGLAQLYPGCWPTAEGLLKHARNAFIDLPPAVVAHTVGLLVLLGALEYVYDPKDGTPGIKLTDNGLLAFNTESTSTRSGLFLCLTELGDSRQLKERMVQMAMVLARQENSKQVIGTFHSPEERLEWGTRRATMWMIDTLGNAEYPVGQSGDIMADWYAMFYRVNRHIAPFFKFNPIWTAEERSDVSDSYRRLRTKVIDPQIKNTAPPNDLHKISERLLKTYPDKFVKITAIEWKMVEGHKVVTWVRGKELCADVGVTVSKDAAFDFLQFATDKTRKWVPTEDLYFIYCRLAANKSGGTYVIERIHRIDAETYASYNTAEWDGQFESKFKFDISKSNPALL